MANGVGVGRIKRMHRGLGIGSIEPDDGGGDVLFPSGAVAGGDDGFRRLKPGDRVKYHEYPEKIAGIPFADDVWPAGESTAYA